MKPKSILKNVRTGSSFQSDDFTLGQKAPKKSMITGLTIKSFFINLYFVIKSRFNKTKSSEGTFINPGNLSIVGIKVKPI